jgi:1-acyl-sn-glycerol-3-phosphate acyltransferase
MQYFKGFVTLCLGLCIFLVSAVITGSVAVLSFGLANPFLLHAPYWTGRWMMAFAYSAVRMTVKVKGSIPHDDVPTIVIANHPSLPLMMVLLGHLEAIIGKPVVCVVKRELLWWLPFVGIPLYLARLAIFINRKKKSEAVVALRSAMDGVFQRKAAILIFPDQSRPNGEKIISDRNGFADKCDTREFTETMLPRDGGFGALLDARPHARVVSVTFGCSQANRNLFDIVRFNHPVVVIHVHDVTEEIPRNGIARRTWLVDHWKVKNQVLRHLRQSA